ncbi:FHA domain-containing protein [Cellulomonas sp. KH9]|uniref:FHA domain-containing protein FhaB/FipA n=1 Tax=Cellulomonas sp. KH9 TaxID=1855324 RepID=UPI0008EEB7B8|nr:FHA domain-containing protein [Cellulomonas sp. KH9]SFK48224.1 Inner membrane component of T3SS domain-containing protein [Cellulomonas sp. KH9]
MSELTITLLRLGYLALLWFLVLSAITVLRRDLYGTRIIDRRRAPGKATPAEAPVPAGEAPRAPRRPRSSGGPTRLVVTEGPLRGTTLPLGSSAVLVGRAPSCTLVLDDDYSSSRHARIFPQGDRWFVEDLGSTNGTFVGESRVEQPTPVPTGTPIRVGQSLLELQR